MKQPTIRIRAVVGAGSACNTALLSYLQLSALPADDIADTSKGWWWVALAGELPVAFAGLYESSQAVGAGYLCRAGVLASHRGLGLQSRLLQVRERKARRLGMTALVSDTFDNPHSTNNLVKAGFRAYDPAVRYGALGTNYWRKPL